jgi:hypothetical protein
MAGLVALGVVGLHFLSTREANTELLPTTRFVPEAAVDARTLAVRLSDVALLALRVLAVLLVGAALARPVLTPARQPVARIVAVDVSRAVGGPEELADSARVYLDGAAATIFFDAEAREVPLDVAVESLAALARSAARDAAAAGDSLASQSVWARREGTRPGSLSAALIAARRVAARLRDGADSLELVVVSPFVREERDAATANIRALWPGRITTVQVAAATSLVDAQTVEVQWADSGATERWVARAITDTVGGIRAGDAVLVYPFTRRWRLAQEPDSATRIMARWVDGEPAAVEWTTPTGCVRSLAFSLPTEGDAPLRPDFQRMVAQLDAPCGAARDFAPLSAAFLEMIRGDGPLAHSGAIERRVQRATPLMLWLLGVALALLLAELLARRGGVRARGRLSAVIPASAGIQGPSSATESRSGAGHARPTPGDAA